MWREPARDANFIVQLRETPGIACEFDTQELERDRLSELQIRGAVNIAPAAAAERARRS
jgi:hypothetical protein